jgi:cytosine/adenosine deaminase-related metal-dependent hydrolase
MSRPSVLQARWVLPVGGPALERGWIASADGIVTSVGQGRPPAAALDLGSVAVLPGLVNAHTHLELSWLAGRIPPAGSFAAWLRTLIAARASASHADQAARLQAMKAAAARMRATGTVLVGDISNTLTSPAVLREAGLGGIVFHELLGFNVADPATLVRDAWGRVDMTMAGLPASPDAPPIGGSVVGHAPYSVSPQLFETIARHRRETPLTVHLGESAEELELLRSGQGALRRLLEDLGVWTDAWEPPASDPVSYIESVGYLQPGLLAVHAVKLQDEQLASLRRARAVVVTCPRSNMWVGAGMPRVPHLYASRVPVAVGTDSLASAPSLNLFDELAELRRIAPDVTAASLLESATRVGAEALGFGESYGTIAPGKRAALVQVVIPSHVRDVEEYLVSGVPAADVSLLTP